MERRQQIGRLLPRALQLGAPGQLRPDQGVEHAPPPDHVLSGSLSGAETLAALLEAQDIGLELPHPAPLPLQRPFRPSQLGKAATAWFILTCVVVMYYNWRGVPSPVVDLFVWVSLGLTLASGIDYVWRIGRGLR